MRDLLVVFVDGNGFQILGLVHLITIEAVHIVDPVAAGQHLGSMVIARTFHIEHHYFKDRLKLVKPPAEGTIRTCC